MFTYFQQECIKVKIKSDSTLQPEVSIICPGAQIDLPPLTEKDEDDILDFGLKKGIDMISVSWTRKASDIDYVRDLVGPRGAHIKIIAKIECKQGMENYHEILKVADGIIIARQYIGLELPSEKVFIA